MPTPQNSDTEDLLKIIEMLPCGLIIMDAEGVPTLINNRAAEILKKRDPGAFSYHEVKDALSLDPLQYSKKTEKEIYINNSVYSAHILPLCKKNKLKNGVVIFLKNSLPHNNNKDITSDFVAIASHELKTPITAIKTALDILMDMADEDSSPQKQLLNTALRNIDRVSSLIKQYLDFTNIKKGKTSLHLKKVDIKKMANSIAGEFRSRMSVKDVEIQVDFPEKVPYVLADPSKLEQVFYNLLENAIKFTKHGSITVSVLKPDTPEKTNGMDSKPMLMVSVTDTGPGIPEGKRNLVFDKFYRVNKSIEMGKEGVGLGLSIVKNLVEIHGGRVHVEANKPAGSQFCFTLPVFSKERRDPGFRWLFDKQFQKARDNQCTLSLLAIVIENLNSLETGYGKKKTNSFISMLEGTIKKSLYRQTDITVRRRQQKMFVVFCDAEKEGVEAICKRINENISNVIKNQFEKEIQDPEISMGFASYPQDAQNQAELFKNALDNAKGNLKWIKKTS